MSEATPKFRIELQTELGGRLNFLTNEEEKAAVFFEKAKDEEVNVSGVFGEVGEDGEITTVIDSFDKRPKEDA